MKLPVLSRDSDGEFGSRVGPDLLVPRHEGHGDGTPSRVDGGVAEDEPDVGGVDLSVNGHDNFALAQHAGSPLAAGEIADIHRADRIAFVIGTGAQIHVEAHRGKEGQAAPGG